MQKCECGCGREARNKFIQGHNIKRFVHGLNNRNSPTHRSWANMKQRCLNPKNDNFPKYGGRGITVCDRWKNFMNFLSDMGNRPVGTTLDRKNNDGNYEPGNCRWATPIEQSRNTRRNKRITIDGRTQLVTDWIEEYGIGVGTFYQRLKRGWDEQRAMTTPADSRFAM